MRNWTISSQKRRRSSRAFTFAELLAAMVFLAIVIPTALHGIAIANRASVYSERKQMAMQLAENLLDEMVATETWQTSSNQGTFDEFTISYRWQLDSIPWQNSELTQLQMTVFYPVQNAEYYVQLSTLVPTNMEETSEGS